MMRKRSEMLHERSISTSMHDDITSASLMLLDQQLRHLHEAASLIREWARLRGVEDLYRASLQAEDTVILAVRRLVPRKRNYVIDRQIDAWMRERRSFGRLDGGEIPPK
jgi:hypothetical protein